MKDDAVQAITGPDPDLAAARQAAIAQTPDAQDRNTPEHPMVAYARGLLSPINYASQEPQGFNNRALPFNPYPTQPPPDIGAALRGATVDNPAFAFEGAPGLSPLGSGGDEAAKNISQVPVLGGALNYGTNILRRGPASTYLLGGNPDYNAIQAMPEGPDKRLALQDFHAQEGLNAAMGGLSLENVGAKAALAARLAKGAQGADQSGIAAKLAEASGSTLTKDATRAASDTADAAAGRVPTADVSTTPRYVVETGKTRSVIRDTTTGKLEPTSFSDLARAQDAVVKLNSAPSAAAQQAAFGITPEIQIQAALRSIPRDVGTTVRQAARAVPDVTAQTIVETPALRSHLDLALAKAKMPATDANATSLADALLSQERARPTVGNKNAQAVREALGAAKPAAADSFDAMVGNAGKPVAAPPAPPSGIPPSGTGAMPPDVPLPIGPRKATAASLATEALHVLTDIPRSLMVIGHLPVLRQGLPLMADAVARGNPLEVPRALGRSFQAVVADPIRAQAITQGFRDTLEGAGVTVGRGGVHISDPLGPIAAREEFGLHSFLARVPGIANLNRAYPTMLNSLRTGAATDLARLYKESGRAINSERIGHFVNIASGRGDIPVILDTPVARDALSGVFFGPRLTAASWQMAADTVGALRDVGGDLLSRRALDPVEVAQVRTTAAYVATGVGIMKLANAFGLNIGVDPTKTDFGRITLPDGKRLDLWGPFNENARLVAREIMAIQGNVQGKPAYGQTTALDGLVSYVRSKLNAGAPTAVGDILAGSTQGGQSIPEAYGTPQGLQEHLLPLPFAVQEAKSGSSQGPLAQAAETALVAAGASVIDTPATVHYDGVGTPDTSQDFGSDPVLQEFMRMQKLDPNWKKDTALQPPDTVIGSGRSSIKLDPTSAALYVQTVGEARRKEVSAVIYSDAYQKATLAQQEKLYDAAVSKADKDADQQFLAHGVIDSTDPKVISAEAVAGFHAQSSNRDRAYWVALLDRAGKLTPEVAKAIEESQVTTPGQRAAITVDEYRKAAPLLHEYLAHAPFGTDTRPIGTPADWTAVAQAHVAMNDRKNELQRGGVNPSLADAQAQREILAQMTSLVQRNLFLNGAQLENPARRQLALKYPSLKSFFPSDSGTSRESDAAYQQFPFGR